jgi:glutaredoxin
MAIIATRLGWTILVSRTKLWSCPKFVSRHYCSSISDVNAVKVTTLTMLTKEECQLCDEAKIKLNQDLPKELMSKLAFEEVDITEDGNEDLYDRWRYEIPVFYLGDQYLCKNRIDIPKLIQLLLKQQEMHSDV